MAGVLLFCVAEEAKPFIRKATNHTWDMTPTRQAAPVFYLVESRVCPKTAEEFKRRLKDDETFETDFIGASEKDCQDWVLKEQFQHPFMEQDLIFIADARSARDDTLLVKDYNRDGIPFERWGTLPPKGNTWYDFRIDYKDALQIYIDLHYGPPETVYPTYYLRAEELTDENGVFSVIKAGRLIIDPRVWDSPQA